LYPNKKIEGRIVFQKTIFILKHLGFPFSEDYRLLTYGPYSHDLFYEIKELKNYDVLDEKGGPPGGPYTYKLIDTGFEILKKYSDEALDNEDIIEKLLKVMSEKALALEILSVVYYLMQKGESEEEAWESVQKIKKSRISGDVLNEAKNLDKELRNIYPAGYSDN
jgi:uncharacterized protein YwgA